MIAARSVLCLKPPQATQLINACVAYRSSLWQFAMPTPERNQVLRGIQTLLGRLEKMREQEQAEIVLSLAGEEKSALRHLLNDFAPFYEDAQQRPEIAELRVRLERAFSQAQTFSNRQEWQDGQR
jgi:hypothetical protein